MFALANILLRPQTMDTPQTLAQKGFLSPFICTRKRLRIGYKSIELFSLHIGSSFLSVSKQQSLIV